MVDLRNQYLEIKDEIDSAIQGVIDNTAFINGPTVENFASELGEYCGTKFIVPCANGTDALQIALMALGLKRGDEVIVPCFTYVATAEVIALLGLKPVLAEVCPQTFNLTADAIMKVRTPKTKAIVPVHLYGQCANMEEIMSIAKEFNLYVVEDTAQAIGAKFRFSDGTIKYAGTIGDIGCTSFFPSKNLGCYGDGGALIVNDEALYRKIKMIANHGQSEKYHHTVIGCNSRLDSIQAAILSVKLRRLDTYSNKRNEVADFYDSKFKDLDWVETPVRSVFSTHVFHQYTLKLVDKEDRDLLREYLKNKDIPSMIYYPIPLHLQKAFESDFYKLGSFPISEDLCSRVISLPIHTEMCSEQLDYIVETVESYKKNNNGK